MKKILTVLLTVLLAFSALCITVFAESGGAVAQMPYIEKNGEEIPEDEIPDNEIPDFTLPEGEELPDDFYDDYYDEYADTYGEEEIDPEFENSLFRFGAVIVLVSLLFMPALVATIVFAVLNSKTKKEIARYESVFGAANGFNAAQQNFAPDYTQNYGQGGNMQ